MVQYFIEECGAAARGCDGDAIPPICYAAVHGDMEMCELLLAHGASARQKTADGRPAVQMAGELNHWETVRMLCKHGANPWTFGFATDIRDGYGANGVTFC